MPNILLKHLPDSLGNNAERAAFLALAGCVSLSLVSIAASQILLAATIAGFFWLIKQHKISFTPIKPILLPLIAFVLWTVIAALASSNVALSLTIVKKFFLLLILLLVPLLVRGEGLLTWIYRAIFAVAVVSSLSGIMQYVSNPHRDQLHRISGFMSQWMTYSGLLMLVLMIVSAYALCAGVRKNKWVIPVGILVVLALIFSLTRNSWAGALAGMIVLLALRRPRAITVLIAAMLIFYLLSPGFIKQRLQSGLDRQDPTTRGRIECFGTAIRLIKDNPWMGVGPKNVKYEALKYRKEHEFPDWLYQHMHNNFLQIAAETGIPGLILWLWFMIRLAWDALRCYRYANGKSFPGGEKIRQEALTASSAALAAWAALLTAGLVEYNFGDSEVLMFFLFIVGSPYVFLSLRSGTPSSNISASEQ
jgi:O-antigen ligase